ncbi:helix-turn-helix transcriptional regulator [Streptomyces macrosporus]|uniref:Helix-turn-helix transcriptional regulator n=1 Tax=Streptomyces macrosporus TaxID=44032 RepID=A0ABP5XSZ0_9ACTN
MAGVKQETANGPEDPSGEFLRSFGRQIKLFRERAGLTQAQLADQLGYGEAQIASIEQGRRIPRPEMIDKADEVLEAGGVLLAMKKEVARARYPAFFRGAARIEEEAVEFHAYATHVVPGLLQTEEYARAVFTMWRPRRDAAGIEQQVAARMARQAIFGREPAPTLSFVLEEAILHRQLGGSYVRRGQLEQLLLVGQNPDVEIQVMPTDLTDNAGVDGPFTLMTPKGGEQVAYLESQGHGRLLTDRETVRGVALRYGIIRAQAMPPQESLLYIEKLLGEA